MKWLAEYDNMLKSIMPVIPAKDLLKKKPQTPPHICIHFLTKLIKSIDSTQTRKCINNNNNGNLARPTSTEPKALTKTNTTQDKIITTTIFTINTINYCICSSTPPTRKWIARDICLIWLATFFSFPNEGRLWKKPTLPYVLGHARVFARHYNKIVPRSSGFVNTQEMSLIYEQSQV